MTELTMTDAEQKRHDAAVERLNETWVRLNGWTPRTFKFDEMTVEEINELTDDEIAEKSTQEITNIDRRRTLNNEKG